MTKPLDPYSRVYWRVLDDKRFNDVRSDMRHFGSWTLMLVVADMAYPAPAFVPSTVPRASLAKLVECGLIDRLPGGLFRVHGMKSERERRSLRGSDADPDRTPKGPAPEPDGTLARAGVVKPSQDKNETSRDAPSNGRAPDPADVYWTLTGKYPNGSALSWIDDLSASYGPEPVIKALAGAHLTDKSSATLIGRAQDLLRSEARALSLKAQEDARQRLKERRASPREIVDPAALQAEIEKILRGEAA